MVCTAVVCSHGGSHVANGVPRAEPRRRSTGITPTKGKIMATGGGMFSPEEVEYLRTLPAVVRVTERRITYSDAFKNACVRRYLAGESPVKLFREAGLDPAIIGHKRIERCFARWREHALDGDNPSTMWNSENNRGGVFLCFCQLLGELTCRDSGWLSWARFALPVASGVLSRVARFRLRGLVPGRGFRF